jgi:site-specific recombinase XerD
MAINNVLRLGNWLTAEQGYALWQALDRQRLKGKRDRALLALLLACGLRRHEAMALTLDHLHPAAQRALGHCGSGRQERPGSNSSGSRLGENRTGRLARRSGN